MSLDDRHRADPRPCAALLLTLLAACFPDDRPIPIATPPAGDGAMAPNLAAAGDGMLLSWLERDPEADGQHRLQVARYRDRWEETSDAPVVSSSELFVNWADIPAVVEEADGSLLAQWLQKSGSGTYEYDIRLARLAPDATSWSSIGKLNDDAILAEHGFVSFARDLDALHAFWLDGRDSAGGHGGGHGGHGAGAMGLRTTRIGAAPAASALLDDRVCDCCPTSAAATDVGPLVVYRDRSDDEVRDIAIVRLVEGEWTEPALVHDDGWRIEGCPVNGPAVAARGMDVAVAWYTSPFDPVVKLAFSDDGGATFTEPVVVDPRDGDSIPLGRVDVALDPKGDAWVLWVTTRHDQTSVLLRRVTRRAKFGPPMRIARTQPDRRSGRPRLCWHDDDLVVVWTELAAESTRLRCLRVPVAAEP